MYLFELMFLLFSLYIYIPRSRIAGSYETIFSALRNSILFSTVAVPIYIPTTVYEYREIVFRRDTDQMTSFRQAKYSLHMYDIVKANGKRSNGVLEA